MHTFRASIIALATSTINVAILTSLQGHELGWLCLASCATDVSSVLYQNACASSMVLPTSTLQVLINALVLDFVTESRLKRYTRRSRAHAIAEHGDDWTNATTPDASARSGDRSRTTPLKTDTIVLTHGTTHSIELRGDGTSEDKGTSSPKGRTASPRSAPSNLASDSPESSKIALASIEAKDKINIDDPKPTSPTFSLLSLAKAYSPDPRAPYGSTNKATGGLHSSDIDRVRGDNYGDRPQISSGGDHSGQEAHSDDPQRYDRPIEVASDDGSEHEFRQRAPTKPSSSPRLFTFTEAIQGFDVLRSPPPSHTPFNPNESPKKLRWSFGRRQLPVLKPMQPPPGVGYLGTSRRMSLPLSPDNTDWNDFYAPSSSRARGQRPSFMGTLPEHSRRSDEDVESRDPCPTSPTSAPPLTPLSGDGESVQREADAFFRGFSFPRRSSFPFMDRDPLASSVIPEPPLEYPGDRRHPILPLSTPSPLVAHTYPPGVEIAPSGRALRSSPVPPETDIALQRQSSPP